MTVELESPLSPSSSRPIRSFLQGTGIILQSTLVKKQFSRFMTSNRVTSDLPHYISGELAMNEHQEGSRAWGAVMKETTTKSELTLVLYVVCLLMIQLQ